LPSSTSLPASKEKKVTKEIALNETALAEVPTGDFMKKAFFPNGRGVSVIRHYGSYGNQQGLFEAIEIVGTPDKYEFTGEPEGWLTPADVVAYARKIAELPATSEALENSSVQEIE
jgi:hypothetical protein